MHSSSWTTAAALNEGVHRCGLARLPNSKSRIIYSIYCGAIIISTPSNQQRAPGQTPQPLPRVLAPAAQAPIRRLHSLQLLTVATDNRTSSGLQ